MEESSTDVVRLVDCYRVHAALVEELSGYFVRNGSKVPENHD